MTPQKQVALIQQSFAKVRPERAAALSYGRLFEIEPAVKLLVRNDMTEEGHKLMATGSSSTASRISNQFLRPQARSPRRTSPMG